MWGGGTCQNVSLIPQSHSPMAQRHRAAHTDVFCSPSQHRNTLAEAFSWPPGECRVNWHLEPPIFSSDPTRSLTLRDRTVKTTPCAICPESVSSTQVCKQ